MSNSADKFQTTHFDLLRHGECEGGAIFRGRTDSCLLEKGMAKMMEQAQRCNTAWDAIISSPLSRCKAFAQSWSEQKKIPLVFDERLIELNFGEWEGLSVDRVVNDDAVRFDAWQQRPDKNSPPFGESLESLCHRIAEFFHDTEKQWDGKKVLIVTHGGVLRAAMLNLLNMPLKSTNTIAVPYACITRFAIYRKKNGHRCVQLLAHNAGAFRD